jgi:hypothetical protein
LTPQQFDEWWAAYQIDPWGEERADLRIGRLACAVEVLARGSDAEWTPADFLLSLPASDDDAGEPQSLDEQASAWELIAAQHGY